MDKRYWFFDQLVTDDELREADDLIETAIRRNAIDMKFRGLVGTSATAAQPVREQSPTPSFYVDVVAGVAIDDQGRVIKWDDTQSIFVLEDSNGTSTAVANPGNERWVSVFAKFVIEQSNPRVDGEGNTVFYNQDESFVFEVVAGAEAAIGVASRPALAVDKVLLADVRLVNAQASVLNADISFARREYAFSIPMPGGGTPLAAGTVKAAVEGIGAALVTMPTGSGPNTFIGLQTIVQTDDEIAAISLTDQPASLFKLLLQARIDSAGGAKYARLYAHRDLGFAVSVNARWDDDTTDWHYDVTADHASLMILDQLEFTLFGRTGGLSDGWAHEAGWADGNITLTLATGELRADGVIHTYGGLRTRTSGAVANPVGVGVPFPRRFSTTPSSFVITPVGSTGNINVGSLATVNPSTVGVGVEANTTAADTNTFFYVDIQAS